MKTVEREKEIEEQTETFFDDLNTDCMLFMVLLNKNAGPQHFSKQQFEWDDEETKERPSRTCKSV